MKSGKRFGVAAPAAAVTAPASEAGVCLAQLTCAAAALLAEGFVHAGLWSPQVLEKVVVVLVQDILVAATAAAAACSW